MISSSVIGSKGMSTAQLSCVAVIIRWDARMQPMDDDSRTSRAGSWEDPFQSTYSYGVIKSQGNGVTVA